MGGAVYIYSFDPTVVPTSAPTQPTQLPTRRPVATLSPIAPPTVAPTAAPTVTQTMTPTGVLTDKPVVPTPTAPPADTSAPPTTAPTEAGEEDALVPSQQTAAPAMFSVLAAFGGPEEGAVLGAGCAVVAVGAAALLMARIKEKEALGDLGPTLAQLAHLLLRGAGLSLSLLALFASASQPMLPYCVLLLLLSKAVVVVLWLWFLVTLLNPYRVSSRSSTASSGVTLFMLLHGPAIDSSASPLSRCIYCLLLVLSAADLQLLKLLPWTCTRHTKALQGCPSFFAVRCIVYGSLASSGVQAAASVVGLLSPGGDSETGLDPATAALFTLVSLGSFAIACWSAVSLMRVSQQEVESLGVAVVSKADLGAVLAFSDANRPDGFSGADDALPEDKPYVVDVPLESSEHSNTALDQPSLSFDPSVDSTHEEVISDDRVSMGAGDIESKDVNNWDGRSSMVAGDVENRKTGRASMGSDYTWDERSSLAASDSDGLFASSLPFADQTVDVLKRQIAAKGEQPAEYIPLPQLKAQYTDIMRLAQAGEPYDEARLEYLELCLSVNPEYRAQQAQEVRRWREESAAFCELCLEEMRSFVPSTIFQNSTEQLIELGLSKELANR